MEYKETMQVPYIRTEIPTEEVIKHLDKIAALFGGWKPNMVINEYKVLWNQIRMYENAYSHYATLECNSSRYYEAAIHEMNHLDEIIPQELAEWFNDKDLFKEYIYLNRDPRGYALKLDTSHTAHAKPKSKEISIDGIYTDRGKYIILCPEINEDFIRTYSRR